MKSRLSLPTAPLLLVLLSVACGGAPALEARPPVSTPAPPEPVKAKNGLRFKAPRMPFYNDLPRSPHRAPREMLAMRSAERPEGSMGSSDYDKIGPSTVVIDDGAGHGGSGVIISADGFVLTNYHVVAGAKLEGLRLAVNIQLGKLAPPDGEKETRMPGGMTNLQMTKSGDPLKAYVHAFDTVNDLAIVKIVKPAGATMTFAPLKIAAQDAPIGSVVHCMGHPGIGGLWTLREGKVEGFRDDVDILSRGGGETDPKDLVEQVRRFESHTGSGRLLQVTCPFTHGDSGGPEVNGAGEIVGVNDRYDLDDSGQTKFGVPASAIRKLAASVPADPIDVIPEAMRDGGQYASLSDASLDGVPETMEISGFEISENKMNHSREGLIIDVGQKSFTEGGNPAIADIRAKRSMRARFSLVREGFSNRAYASYDLDDDGKPDVVLVGGGREIRGFRIENGVSRADPALGRSLFVPELFADATERGRFEAALVSLRVTSQTAAAPDAVHGGGNPVSLADRDQDGKPETAFLTGPYSHGFAIDATQTFLGQYLLGRAGAEDLSLDGAPLDMSILFAGGSRTYVYTAAKAAGKLDTRIRFGGYPAGLVESIEAMDGSPGPADAVGRKAVRPGLMNAAAWPRIAKVGLAPMFIGADDGIGSFPSVQEDTTTAQQLKIKKVVEKRIFLSDGNESTAVLIDIDGDTWKGKKTDVTPKVLVSKGEVKAELVLLARGEHAWTFYDTDHDGKVDIVLYAGSEGPMSTQAYRIDKAGKVTLDPAIPAGPMVRFSLFKGPLAGQLKALLASTKLFPESATEPLR